MGETEYKLAHEGPEIDEAIERALPGGEIDQSTSAKLDWEGLINPEFTIAQAGIGGNHGSIPYAADCWKLVSGTVSAAPGGGLVLNGTIRQTREKAVGFDVVASINVTSGTATATYDDATKRFDITSSGGTIKRAHLGLIAITDWAKVPPSDFGEELRKCQRCFCKSFPYPLAPTVENCGGVYASIGAARNNGHFSVRFPVEMRTAPSVSKIGVAYCWVDKSDGSESVTYDEQILALHPTSSGFSINNGFFNGMATYGFCWVAIADL